METVLNLLLIRFAVIAVGVVALTLLAFAALLAVRRRGRMGHLQRYAEPLVRATLDGLDQPVRSRRQTLLRTAVRMAARSLDDRATSRRTGE